MSEWTIRSGARADIPAVLGLWRAAGGTPSATDDAESVAALLEHDPESLLVATFDGELVGSLIAAWDGWRGSFYRLAVHPGWRRRGLAGALVEAGERRLTRLGAVRLTAIVVDGEPAAAGLWESAGYARQEERSRFVRTFAERAPMPSRLSAE